MTLTLYTSINPKMSRNALGEDVSIDYQYDCMQSWCKAGFNIVTINNIKEIDWIKGRFPEIGFIETEAQRPTIVEFMAAALREGHASAGIINSDCLFLGDVDMARRIELQCRNGLILTERWNLESNTFKIGGSCQGFDAFFFDTSILPRMTMNKELRIGDTWWDYIFPLSYLEAGGDLYLTSPLLLHLNHEVAWDAANYISGGLTAQEMFAGKFGLLPIDNDDIVTVGAFAEEFFLLLRTTAKPINLRGDGIAAQMLDQLANNVRLKFEENRKNIEIQIIERIVGEAMDLEKIVSVAVNRFRISRASNRRIGELLCTVSVILRTLRVGNRLADTFFKLGDDLQFRLYCNPADTKFTKAGTSD